MKIKSFQDLIVWKLASQLSKEIAFLVRTFPKNERYELIDDLVRAARSIPSNISEGFGRFYFNEKIQFYNIARGSATEVQNHLIEAKNLEYLSGQLYSKYIKQYHTVEIKLNNLIKATLKARKRYTKK